MKNLLVPVDFSEVTVRVVSAAEQLAHALGAKVWLLHCVTENKTVAGPGEAPFFVPSTDESLSARFPTEHRQLMELVAALRHKGLNVEPVFESGNPIDVILGAATLHRIDLIIMGSHGHGVLYELLVGTVAKFVLLRAGRPTLVIPSVNCETQTSLTIHERKWLEVGQFEFSQPEFFGMSN